MKILRAILLGGALGLGSVALASSAFAHHSASMFDNTKEVAIEGTVKGFQYVNPHAWLLIDAKAPDGKSIVYSFELAAPTALTRMGIKKNTFLPGEKLTARGHPMRDGRLAAEFTYAVKADGKRIGGMLGAPPPPSTKP